MEYGGRVKDEIGMGMEVGSRQRSWVFRQFNGSEFGLWQGVSRVTGQWPEFVWDGGFGF